MKHTPLGLYIYPAVMFGALAGLSIAMLGGLSGSLGLHESLLYALLALLVGWGAAARFDRLERRVLKGK